MPLDQLLAAYGYKIGPDGTRERIHDDDDPGETADGGGSSAIIRAEDQVHGVVKTEQRQSPRTRQQTKPELKVEAGAAVKSEPAAAGSRQMGPLTPASPAEAQEEVRQLLISQHMQPQGPAVVCYVLQPVCCPLQGEIPPYDEWIL